MPGKTRGPLDQRRGPSLNVILTVAVVVVAAIVIGGILLFNDSGSDGGTASRGKAAPSQTLMPAGAHELSRAQGGEQVTLVEFLDFQCPACAGYYKQVTRKLEQDYAGKITFVARPFPLDTHPLAELAARAAEAAGKQDKFSEMYHQLYDKYETWAVDGDQVSSDAAAAGKEFEGFAKAIGLNLAQYRTDLDSADVRDTVAQGVADGTKLGVNSTPTFFVDGVRFEPTGETFAEVDQQLRAELDEALGE